MRGWLFAVVPVVALVVTHTSRAEAPSTWTAWTTSPRVVELAALDSLERSALEACGPGDTGLSDTAKVVLARKLRGLPMPELDAIEALQRSAGEPHPWPRIWAVSGRSLDDVTMLAKLGAWLGTSRALHFQRCGVAAGASSGGTRALVVIAVDALADLAPLPTRARSGQWLTVEARLRARASGGRVVVLGPGGAPRTVPSWFDGTTLRARFAPDRPGETTVQVVADFASGPRPVLEATVLADVEPPAQEQARTAPGEDVAAGTDDGERLTAMVVRARASASLAPLTRDERLDRVARDHAKRMAAAHELAHDVGDGDPLERLRAAGLEVSNSGENVAHAASVDLAHRALWASPSHRANLLSREFDRVGIAVVRDDRGDAWAVETFAGRLR